MKTKCGYCNGTGEVEIKTAHEPPCPKCGCNKLRLSKGEGWFCKACNAGPYLICVNGLVPKRTKSATE